MVFPKKKARWQKLKSLQKLSLLTKSEREYIQKIHQKDKMDIKQSTEVKGVNLLLIRDEFSDKSTLGKLFLNGEMFCDTLELPYLDNQRSISCIPSGEYKVRLRTAKESATRDYLHLLVQEVQGRSYILVHIGNYPRDTKGCILVGQARQQDSVSNSRLAMELLIKEVLNLGGTNINLIIKNN
jgi:hypothetical protein|tara:strand:- start:942 stop:1490 length:549 start_codon:yes stop_codon:yes gene_type:complete